MISNGENISVAITVLKETYKNLSVFFSEMDRIAVEENFTVLTPRFLRFKSNSDHEGWLTGNFIKLYRDNGGPTQHVYGIEVELEESDEVFPTLSVTKFTFINSIWSDRLSLSDHWVFFDPFRYENHFKITVENDIYISTTEPKSLKRYMDLVSAISKPYPLVSIQSPEVIRNVVFPAMRSL